MGSDNNQLMLFEGRHEVMILTKEDVSFEFKGDFLIRAKDVSAVVGYAQTNDFVSLIKPKYVYKVKNSNLAKSQNRKLHNTGEIFVSSFGLNQGLSNSTLPKAEPFQDWLFEEALPSIQRTGSYSIAAAAPSYMIDDPIGRAEKWIEEEKRRKSLESSKLQLEQKIVEDRPKVLFAECLEISKDSVLVADLAKILKQNGVDVGERRLFEWLRSEGYLIKSGSEYNMPTQRSMDLKIMEIKVGYRGGTDGTPKITRTPKITGKGQSYFINRFKNLVPSH